MTQTDGFGELMTVMRTEVNRRRKGRDAIHFNSTSDEFAAFEKRSLYVTGFIQGLEFGINVMESVAESHASLEAQIKELAAEIKATKKDA